MPIFVVERRLPGLTPKHLEALRKVLGEASRRLSQDGDRVRHIQSRYEAAAERCTCIFEASSRAAVVKVNEIAQVPFVSVRPIPGNRADGESSQP